MRCTGDHEHVAFMCSAKATCLARHYTKSFAKAVVPGLMDHFAHETATIVHETSVADASLKSEIDDGPLGSDDEAEVPSEIAKILQRFELPRVVSM